MKTRLLKITTAIWLITSSIVVLGQDKSIVTENSSSTKANSWITYLTTNTGTNGLIDNRINAILKSSDNKYYYGTDEGLSIKDGDLWTTLTKADGLGRNTISALLEAADGTIWIGTEYGGISKLSGGVITTYTTSQGLANNSVKSIIEAADNTIWVGTINGVSHFDGTSWFSSLGGLPSSSGYDLAFDSGDNLWIAGANGLSKYDGTTITTFTTTDGLPDNYTTSLAVDASDNIWIGTGWSGLVKYDGTTFTNYTESDNLVDDGIKDLALDEAENLWIATFNGVGKFNGTTFTNYSTTDGLVNNSTNTIFLESATSLVFGTEYGISNFNGGVWSTINTADGLISNYLLAVHGNQNGLVAFGTYQFGTSVLNGTNWESACTQNNKLQGNWINSVFVASNNDVWIGTISSGIVKYDGTTYTNLTTTDGLPDNDINYITGDDAGNIWIATSGGGVAKYDGSSFTVYTQTDGLASNTPTYIAINGNEVWIAGGGVTKMLDGNFTIYTNTDGLPTDYIESIAFANDLVYFGSSSGLTSFDGTNFVTKTYTDGLPSSSVEALGVDANGYLWIGTNSGASRLNGNAFENYTVDNSSLVGNYINSIYCDKNTNVWFATTTGCSVLEQDLIVTATLATVTTTAITAIAQTTATSGGNVSSDGGAEVTARGICWNTAANPTIDNSKTSDGTGIGEFTSSLSGLTANTTYYVRAYATNSEGTAYGNEINFTTLQEASTQEYASLPFNENFDGTWIDKDDTRDVPSVYWKNTPVTGNNSWRRFDDGTTSGAWSFDSGAYSPSGANSSANSARFHTYNSSNGQVGILELYVDFSSLTGEKELSFSYINPSGTDWLTIYVSTDGGNNYGTGIFHQVNAVDWEAKSISLGDLTSTQGVIKFEAVSDWGNDDIGLDEVSITTATSSGTIADIDGNLYDTVRIGTQTWFAQELKTSKYRNGDEIPGGFNGTDWTQTTGAQAVYGNEDGAFFEYGRLYNHYAVTDPRGLCPDGWRVPADTDWNELMNYLGGSSVAGGKMKEIGTVHWNSPNTGATNESGFNGLPGGKRGESGTYDFINVFGLYWSYTEYSSSNGNAYYLWYNSSTLSTYDYGKSSGLSVRCIKGEDIQVQLPTVSTTTISGITKTTATGGGNITSDGGAEVTARGVCWSTAANPTLADSKTSDGAGIGEFASSLSGLTANTTYYVRAYATNSEGTAYGNELSFTTLALTPTVAAFSADVTTGTAPLSVQFTDASSGNPTSWSWDFNNDGTEDATTQNPSFTYTNAGTYSVKLTVSNADGSDDELKTDYIVVSEAAACLNPDNYSMNFETDEDLTFWSYLDGNNDGDYWGIASDKGINGTACATYSFNATNAANDWLFTPCFDMEAGKKYRISFSYAAAGSSFPEKLALGFGSSADESMNIVLDLGTITNTDYTNASYDVSISSSGSYHFGWKCYSDADMWNVYLDGVTLSLVTESEDLIANFTADMTEGLAPLTVTFTDLSTGNPTAWAWDFNNDGTFDSYEQNPTHTYTTPGTFSVKLVVATSTQENGITFNDYITVNPVGINNAAENALFNLYPNPSHGMAYLKLTEYTGALNIEVMDLAGKTVIKQSENYLNDAIIPIDLKAANTGIYFIKVSTDRGISMKKLIIE